MSSPSSAPPPPKKRSACDRCHDKKICCIVQGSNKFCERCQKSGFSCHFSYPAKTGRPPTKPSRHDHPKQRGRRYTTPSTTSYRSRSDSLLSSITPLHSTSLSSSPSTFPPAMLSTPAINTNFEPIPSLDHRQDCYFAPFGGPFSVEPSTLVPPSSEATEFFDACEYPSSLLTPTSIGPCCESSWPPVSAISPLVPAFQHFPGSNQNYNHVTLPIAQPVFTQPFANGQMLETLGNLDGTMRELADLEKALSGCTSSPTATEDLPIEHLLGAVGRVPSILQPYFTWSPNSPVIAQSLETSTLTSMIAVVRLAADGLDAVINPATASIRPPKAHSRMHSLGSLATTSISPQTLHFPSPMPQHQATCLQLSPTPAFSTPTLQGSSSVAASSPMCFSSSMTSSSSGTHIAPAISMDALPVVSPTVLGTYISHEPEMNRWVLANIMLFQISALLKLHRSMATCLDFQASTNVPQQLEDLGTRIRAVRAGLRRLVNRASSDDDLYSG